DYIYCCQDCLKCSFCFSTSAKGTGWTKNPPKEDACWVCVKVAIPPLEHLRIATSWSLHTETRLQFPFEGSFLLCEECAYSLKNNYYCRVCDSFYSEHDYSIPMCQCDICDQWIHSSCDPSLVKTAYKNLRHELARYHCPLCRASLQNKQALMSPNELHTLGQPIYS